jgi:hypothetical protein
MVLPLSPPSTPSKLGGVAADDFSSKKRMQVSVGIDREESEFFASPFTQPALEFLNFQPLQCLIMGLEKSLMLRYLIRPVKGHYIFAFGERATRSWLLAVGNAAVALYISRMDSVLTDYEIARSLLHQGIAFYTCASMHPIRAYTAHRVDYDPSSWE